VNTAGSTIAVVDGVPTALSPAQPAGITVGAQTVTANAAGSFVIGTATLSAGGPPLSTSGKVISFATNNAGATVAVIDGITTILELPSLTQAPVIIVDGSVYSATTRGSSTFFVVHGTTVKPGQVVTIRGSTIAASVVLATATRTDSDPATFVSAACPLDGGCRRAGFVG
jgi:hypothetical protein